jgi:ureidoacrylate peracid hydrolase
MNRALLVVDMQNGFCHPEGSFTRIGMGLEGAGEAVRNAATAVEQARRAGMPVVEVLSAYRLAEIESITKGYEVSAAGVPVEA